MGCTVESILEDNARFLEFTKKHKTNYILIKDIYEVDIDLDL